MSPPPADAIWRPLAALPPTSPSPEPAASARELCRTSGNPLPDLLEARDMEIPDDLDAEESAGRGADERIEVGVPVDEQPGPLLELG